MLDHVFTDAIASLRDALESAMLERQALEERFQTDVLLGDITWETSYGLPGEGSPPRVRTDLTLAWPTWAQTAYRTWFLDEELTEGPRIEIDVVFRIQHLDRPPDPALIAGAIAPPPAIGSDEFQPAGVTLESTFGAGIGDAPTAEPSASSHAAEVNYHGSYELDETILEDGSALDTHVNAIGAWIASSLVRLGDLGLAFTDPMHHGE